MSQTVSIDELTDVVGRILVRHGVRPDNAAPVAETVVAAERDGSASHGLLRMPGLVNGRRRMVVWDGKRKILGTNPMGFACPRPGRLPLVWDQASSVMAQGE